jgi:hypothetical protein
MSKTINSTVESVPASTHIKFADANDPRIIRCMQNLLKREGNPVKHIQDFTLGREKLSEPIMSLLKNATIPVTDTKDLDSLIEEHNKVVSSETSAMNEATAELDAKITKLEAERNLICEPFEIKMDEHRTANEELAEQKGARVKPVVDAIQSLTEELKKLAKENGVEEEFLFAYIQIDSPVSATRPTVLSSGTGRGRGGAIRVRISKGGKTQEFGSLNAARAYAYRQIHNVEPNSGANAASCESFLENAGYVIEKV